MLTRVRIACVLGLAAFLTGCPSNNQIALPPPGSVAGHLFVSNHNPAQIWVYNLPLTSSSVPSVTLSVGYTPNGLAVSNGKLYVAQGGATSISVYQLPLTTSSTAVQTLTTSGCCPIDVVADASGTIYSAEDESSTCCVDVYTGGTSSPSFTLSSASVNAPFGVALDSSGNLFLANTANIGYFAASVHSGQAGITFGRDLANQGLVADSSDNLYVANGDGNGTIDVYHPPYSTSSSPSSTVTLGGLLGQMAIGSDGTMYTPSGLPNQIDVLKPPYTALAFGTPTAGVGAANGVAVGP